MPRRAAPDGFDEALVRQAPLPEGVTFLSRAGRDLDVVVLFVTAPPPTSATASRGWCARSVVTGGCGSRGRREPAAIPTDLTFDSVQATGLDAGLVDNKSAAVDDVFQGLQFVPGTGDRGTRR